MTDKFHDDSQRSGCLPRETTHADQVHDAQAVVDRAASPAEMRAGEPLVTPLVNCRGCGSGRIVQVLARCSDMCGVQVAGRRHHGYVPRDLGIGGGDDVQLAYCLDCGRMRGEFPLPRTAIEDGRSADGL